MNPPNSNNLNPFVRINSAENVSNYFNNKNINKTISKNRTPLQLKIQKNIIQNDNINIITENLKKINKKDNLDNNKNKLNGKLFNEIIQNEELDQKYNHNNCFQMYSPEKELKLDFPKFDYTCEYNEKKIENLTYDIDSNFSYVNNFEEMQNFTSIIKQEIPFDDL